MLVRPPITDRSFRWSAKEVVRDIDERPHLFVRLELTGPHFPARALEPFVQVGTVRSRLVRIEDEGLRALAYFDRPVPAAETVEFGYGHEVLYRFPRKFTARSIAKLERGRLPEGIRIPDGL